MDDLAPPARTAGLKVVVGAQQYGKRAARGELEACCWCLRSGL